MAGNRGLFRCCSIYDLLLSQGTYWYRSTLLVALTIFLWCFFSMIVPSWVEGTNEIRFLSFPLGFYMSAQGSIIGFIWILFWYNKEQTKIEGNVYGDAEVEDFEGSAFMKSLNKIYGIYGGGFACFVLFLAFLEGVGVSDKAIGYMFVAFTIMVYAAIGCISSSNKETDFYVAGHQVPAIYNGMATAADWMSGASFVGMAGTLYAAGYNGLAFLIGWTGGYVLVATLIAPFLRKYKAYTVPDFLAHRYGGVKCCGKIDSSVFARLMGIAVLVASSFTYLTAQVYSTGIIMSRFLDITLETGCYIGLVGILFCSMLGGMRGVTWTQVAQYIVLIVAYILPVVWMSLKTHDVIVPQLDYGKALADVGDREVIMTADCQELEDSVWTTVGNNCGKIEEGKEGRKTEGDCCAGLEESACAATDGNAAACVYDTAAKKCVVDTKLTKYEPVVGKDPVVGTLYYCEAYKGARPSDAFLDKDGVADIIKKDMRADTMIYDPEAGEEGEYVEHSVYLAGNDREDENVICYEETRIKTKHCLGDGMTPHIALPKRLVDWWMLTCCLMLGTASLPHVLMRYFTTRSVRQARESVSWSLFFIALLYITAPALAVYAKWNIYKNVIGSSLDMLPDWIFTYGKSGLVTICGVGVENVQQALDACLKLGVGYTGEGTDILRWKELSINKDVVVISTPEANGLPYVIAGLTAAGGLAASLSTADGLLLAISNSLSHDLWYKIGFPMYRSLVGLPAEEKFESEEEEKEVMKQRECRKMAVSRVLLVIIAFIAAYAASTKPSDILEMVAWAFSIAASGNFTALFLGVWWKRTNAYGAIAGSFCGFFVCLLYIIGVRYENMEMWGDVATISAGMFGIPIAMFTTIVVSLLTPEPSQEIQDFVEKLREPELPADKEQPEVTAIAEDDVVKPVEKQNSSAHLMAGGPSTLGNINMTPIPTAPKTAEDV